MAVTVVVVTIVTLAKVLIIVDFPINCCSCQGGGRIKFVTASE
jgi:hypothetical protein